jgi:hypothetical protein
LTAAQHTSAGFLDEPLEAAPRTAARARLAVGAGAVYAASTIFRAVYVLWLHHPRHHVYTDAAPLVALAQRLATAPETQSIGDTIWPPGTSALLALLLARDATLGLAALVNVLLGAAVPLLVAHTVAIALGRRAGLWALVLASLHFGFIHYGGFFLSEQLFQLTVALAIWCSAMALAGASGGGRLGRLAVGAGVGLAWALATSVRPTALPVAVAVGLGLAAQAVAARDGQRLALLGAGAVAFAAGLAPLAWRCTVLVGGGFCPVSTNFAMNVALGQAGDVAGLAFQAAGRPDISTSWVPPALLHHGFTGMRTVPTSIYDTVGVLRWVAREAASHPAAFVARALGNALDLFRFEHWPDDEGPAARVAKQAFFLAVVGPGLLGLARVVRRAIRERTRAPLAGFFVLTLLAVVGTAALSLGEARYRIPFDGVLILFALTLWHDPAALFAARPRRAPRDGRGTVALAAGGLVAALLLAAIAVTAWPGRRAGARASAESAARAAQRAPFVVEPASALAAPRSAGSAWDAPGNHRFQCAPTCEELRLAFDGPRSAPAIEVSVDNNDGYRVAFYRGGVARAAVDLQPDAHGAGLAIRTVTAPADALPFDAVGICPLYGDGSYAVGHLRPLAAE